MPHTMRTQTLGVVVAVYAALFSNPLHGQQAEDQRTIADPLHPPLFLEASRLFWTSPRITRAKFPFRAANLLEADIFPHFMVGFPSRCRGKLSPAKPCISVTPAVRLRMGLGDSTPVVSPSFILRLNVQWLFFGDNDADVQGLTVQAGHHSNGQTGCLFAWATFRGDGGMCADNGPEELLALHRNTDTNTSDGNFSLNFFRGIYNFATYNDVLGAQSMRVSFGVEWTPHDLMYRPMRVRYPTWRFLFGMESVLVRNIRGCGRLDVAVKFKFLDTVRTQLSCVVSEERGLGYFWEGQVGRDDYNSAYFDDPVARILVGFAINRLRVFGGDY